MSIHEALRKYGQLYRDLYRYRNKISIQTAKINSRLKKLEEKIFFYKEKGELDVAVLYAKEYKNLYIVREVLWHIRLNIDGVLGRIDTIKTVAMAFEDFDTTIKTLNNILKDSKLVYGMFSQVSTELLNSYNDIRDTIVTPELDFSSIFIPSEDALDILKDIERKVGEELSKKFPSIPVHLDRVLSEDIEQGITKLYNTVATDGGVTTVITAHTHSKNDVGEIKVKLYTNKLKNINFKDLSKIERMSINYLVRMSRRSSIALVNIYSMARLFRATPLQILDSLYSLCEAGLISFV